MGIVKLARQPNRVDQEAYAGRDEVPICQHVLI